MKKIWCLLILGTFIFTSCQEEEREVIDPTIDNTIPKDSQLARLMKNVVTHDGSFDDIVDGANCYSINIPYTITLNNKDVIINSIADYQDLLITDNIQIQYPIVITLSDHKEVMITSSDDLKVYADSCKADDDDIECIDFVYPLQLSVFDTRTNQFSTVDVGHDSQMFTFMSNIDDNTSVSINYPINLISHNGQNIDAQHNSGLLQTILDIAYTCQENDK